MIVHEIDEARNNTSNNKSNRSSLYSPDLTIHLNKHNQRQNHNNETLYKFNPSSLKNPLSDSYYSKPKDLIQEPKVA